VRMELFQGRVLWHACISSVDPSDSITRVVTDVLLLNHSLIKNVLLI
jgi:hypothetical protein